MSKNNKKKHIKDILLAERAVDALIAGDFEQIFEAECEECAPLFSKINMMRTKMQVLNSDIHTINEAVFVGDMGKRIDMVKHEGAFGELSNAFNYNVDLIACLLSDISFVMQRVVNGDFSARVTTVYHGDFDILKKSVNNVIGSLHGLAVDSRLATTAMRQGNLTVRLDASKYKGEYATICSGLNDTMDAVVSVLQDATKNLIELSHGNFSAKIETKYVGDYALIAEAVNNLADMMKSSIVELSRVMGELSNGKLSEKIDIDLPGDMSAIKDSTNSFIVILNEMIFEISATLKEMQNGNLTKKITLDMPGELVEIKNSINSFVESLSEIITQIVMSANEISIASSEVSGSSNSISSGAETQASSIEETTSSI